jgi:hypothetical protein
MGRGGNRKVGTFHHSDESKQKMSKSHIGKKVSDNTRKKMSEKLN